MNKLLDDLQNLLAKETDLYKRLLTLLQNEREIIHNFSSPDILNANNKKKEVAVLQIKLLEESRRKLLEKISQEFFQPSQSISLAQIIDKVKEPHLSSLKAAYSNLKSLAQAVHETNLENAAFIKGSLQIIQGSLSFLLTSAKSGPLYQRTGRVNSEFAAGPMFQKEA